MSDALRPSDSAVTLAGIRQFGLAADGSDLRDIERAITSLSAEVERLRGEQEGWNEERTVLCSALNQHSADCARLRTALGRTSSSALALLRHFNPCMMAEDRSQQWQALYDQVTIFNAALSSSPASEPVSDAYKLATCPKCGRQRNDFDCADDRCAMAAPGALSDNKEPPPSPCDRAPIASDSPSAHERESAVAKAIHEADCGYAIRLKSLTDDGDTYDAKYELTFPTGEKPLTFASHDAAYTYATGWRFQRMARAAIRALATTPPDDGWRTIESAPKDGTHFWAFEPTYGQLVIWWDDKHDGCWMDWADTEPEPTHWRPLPAPPAALAAKESQGGEQ